MKLVKGIYENLISKELEAEIAEAKVNDLICKSEGVDFAELPKILADYISIILRKKLEDKNLSTDSKKEIANKLLTFIGANDNDELVTVDKLLSEVITRQEDVIEKATQKEIVRPLSGFRVSNLFTGGQSTLSLEEEIKRDIYSADQIYIIVSFLKMSGIRMLIDDLKRFCEQDGHSLHIITTTYCGITEGKAIEELSKLSNTEIRISYNSKIERLHAKSYIFVRNSGLSTAYIGSSNLSRSAQTDGLEWNIRVTNIENPHIIKSAIATFNMYWDSPNFEDFRVGGINKFNEVLNRDKIHNVLDIAYYDHYTLLPHQKMILDKLEVERDDSSNYRNLVVAATGTGKTVVSAFDFLRFRRNHPNHDKLLFVAHREEILKQSLYTYRSVLQDANFGDIWVGNYKPNNQLDYLFVSVQTMNSQFDLFSQLGADYYNYLVIDEAHHIAADSYRKIINFFRPDLLLGLTATPERMDGKSLLPDFNNKISAEIRLPQALDEGLLTPFQYLCITDPTDLSDDELWQGNKYITTKLTDRLCNKERVKLIIDKLHQYLADETKCRALCFCSDTRHADFMAKEFRSCGLRAESLTHNNKDDDRSRLNKELSDGKINYLCVVDMLNEGVDIPEVDTVLFLRPTESLTIFLQQLGRGLRLSVGKDYLTVFDFVAQLNKKFDFASRFQALCIRHDKSIEEQVKKGFTLLPHGCSIYMEEKTQKNILENIHGAVYNISRLIKELRAYDICPTLGEFIGNNGQDIRIIYRNNHCWSGLKKEAGKCIYTEDENTKRFEKGMGGLIHINTVAYLHFIRTFVERNCNIQPTTDKDRTFAIMLYYNLFQDRISKIGANSVYDALKRINDYPIFKQELLEIVDYRLSNLENKTYQLGNGYNEALELYGCYTREEIFAIFGRQTADKKMQGSVSGVFKIDEMNTELFFVTLNKSDKDFSPTTQYNDYLMSDTKFHWQSQNTDSHKLLGKRFVDQKNNEKRFILFIRENKKDGYGNTSPFHCLGLIDYITSYGDYPMDVEWTLREPAMPQYIKAI